MITEGDLKRHWVDIQDRAQARRNIPRFTYRLDERTVALNGAVNDDVREHVTRHALRVTRVLEGALNTLGTGQN